MRDYDSIYINCSYHLPTLGYSRAGDVALGRDLEHARRGIERSRALLRQPVYPWSPRPMDGPFPT